MSQEKLYVITRSDMSIGLQAAQISHAVIEWCLAYPDVTRSWSYNSNYIAILAVDNEDKLSKLLSLAQTRDVKYSCFREPDLDNQITAIVLEPGINSKKLTSSIKLMG